MIKIVSDSTCDLPQVLIEKYNIQIVPLHIMLGDKEYLDGVEISPDEIYAWADANEDTPKTSAIGFEEASNVMTQIVGTEDEVIIFTISGKMSTTANVFRMVAEDLGVEDKVSVIDSENLSTGVGILAVEAAEMSLEGKSREEICQRIEKLKEKEKVSFVVDSLTFLHRGGRCSSVASLAGGVLKLHPRIVVSEGSMSVDKKYRGKIEKAILDYVRELEDSLKEADRKRVFITHSGCKQEIIDEVYGYLKEMNHFNEIYVSRAGGVISSHCGPSTLGVLYLEK
ncbi:MAG: DegV family protein [Roseburia sp.]|nr:DegV family protein [Roseburia sp.]